MEKEYQKIKKESKNFKSIKNDDIKFQKNKKESNNGKGLKNGKFSKNNQTKLINPIKKKGKSLKKNPSLINNVLSFTKTNFYRKEKRNQNQPISSSTENLKIMSNQAEKCICKIKKNEITGTGFFCSIPFPDKYSPLPVLITNNHILEEEDIINGKEIKFSMKNGKFNFNIKIDNSRKTFTSKKYDITVIEIKKDDKLDLKTF